MSKQPTPLVPRLTGVVLISRGPKITGTTPILWVSSLAGRAQPHKTLGLASVSGKDRPNNPIKHNKANLESKRVSATKKSQSGNSAKKKRTASGRAELCSYKTVTTKHQKRQVAFGKQERKSQAS